MIMLNNNSTGDTLDNWFLCLVDVIDQWFLGDVKWTLNNSKIKISVTVK